MSRVQPWAGMPYSQGNQRLCFPMLCEVLMSLYGSILTSARFRMWLQQPSGPEVTPACVGWTKHAAANPLVYWVRSLVPEALAHQVRGVNWRWGLLIGDGSCLSASDKHA